MGYIHIICHYTIITYARWLTIVRMAMYILTNIIPILILEKYQIRPGPVFCCAM